MSQFVEILPLIIFNTVVVSVIVVLTIRKLSRHNAISARYLLYANLFFLLVLFNEIFIYIHKVFYLVDVLNIVRTFIFKFYYAGMASVMLFLWFLKQELFNNDPVKRKKNKLGFFASYSVFLIILFFDAYVTKSDFVSLLMFIWTFFIFLIPIIIYVKDLYKLYGFYKQQKHILTTSIRNIIISIFCFGVIYFFTILEEIVFILWTENSIWITGALWSFISLSSVFMYLGFLKPAERK